MILPKVIDQEHAHFQGEYISPDVPTSKYIEHDKEAFNNYPKFDYKFNSRGFRDEEWPEDTSNVLWLVGDSGSMGVGVAYEDTYPVLLEKALDVRVIKACKINGNNYFDVFMYAKEILTTIKPKVLLVQWSFLWRNHIPKAPNVVTSNKMDAQATLGYIKNLEKIKGNTRLIHLVCPMVHCFCDFIKHLKDLNVDTVYIEDVDLARDNMHIGIESHKLIAKATVDFLNENNIDYRG